MNHKIAAIIPYSTNDYKFLRHCIKNLTEICSQIIVVYSDYFYDGTPENKTLIKRSIEENPEATFVIQEWQQGYHPQYWINKSKVTGYNFVSDKTDYILLIDTDEIAEQQKFRSFLDSLDTSYNSYCFASYWYFREPSYQANAVEYPVVMVRYDKFRYNILDISRDRQQCMVHPCQEKILINGDPIFHHYSWVRTEEEMLKKVSTWGHKFDRNWVDLVKDEFRRPFNGRDFVHGYTYKEVTPLINL